MKQKNHPAQAPEEPALPAQTKKRMALETRSGGVTIVSDDSASVAEATSQPAESALGESHADR